MFLQKYTEGHQPFPRQAWRHWFQKNCWPRHYVVKSTHWCNTRCNELQRTVDFCRAHCRAHCRTHCNTLQYTATLYCNTLQHTATHCSKHCNPLQHTATPYNNTLQHTRKLLTMARLVKCNQIGLRSWSRFRDPISWNTLQHIENCWPRHDLLSVARLVRSYGYGSETLS